ncbi:P-type ATPase [Dictyostelium purpureum]|uniref:Calcium-transporting ATPase n=1 Tax=Dictyostelium purpureum TaxID=5786 RepID=F1A3H7_DICPU|nr:P-type ATPase [Dictyostelium purpureum]EGC29255.1 P-type ATPase [Dictyostelium purpureum]|eukprot:XP_003294224.1 P-type ATPase [Dictyostelium purpureum]
MNNNNNYGYSQLQSFSIENDITKDELSDYLSNDNLQGIKDKYRDIGNLASRLGSNIESGLTSNEASSNERIERFGVNKMNEIAQKSLFFFIWQAIHDKTLIILIISAVVSIVLGLTVEDRKTGWIDGTAILVAVVIVVLVTAGNDYNKEKKFRKLNSIRNERKVSVIRGGHLCSISIYDIVVGDVVKLETGDTIPADGIYIGGQNCSVDESSMTGESDQKRKSNEEPFFLSGCQVLEGSASMLVLAVGENSQWGKLRLLLQSPNSDTPLTQKLEKLAETIGKFGLIAAILTFAVLLLKFIIVFVKSNETWHWSQLGTIVGFVVTSITIIVVAVPEGLPLAVTISLAYSMMKMMKDQNLVRHLEACETMGGATNICSDKTGTLTQNRMTVVKKFIGKYIEPEDLKKGKYDEQSSSSIHSFSSPQEMNRYGHQSGTASDMEMLTNPDISNLLAESISLNSTAFIEKHSDRLNDHIGSKTECALLEWLETLPNQSYENIRHSNKSRIVKAYPFSSENKMSAVMLKSNKTNGGYIVYVKGAAEIVLGNCSNIIDKDAQSVPISRDEKMLLQKDIELFASDGLRTLVLAYKEMKEDPSQSSPENEKLMVYSKLTFLCLVGIKDPVRKEVPKAVKRCQSAGIMVRMLTGDNILTAKNIARECGILKEGGVAMEGPEFRKLTDDQLDTIIPHLQVIARCSPTDKYRLVHRLRERGEVVAVTGDGVNDAPQLKEADVGFSMGIAGTEVAKEASDIVLLDDNFNSISKAVIWGRNVYDSIRKFIQFQLTVNIVAVLIAFVGAITNGESPLRPVQLLWVNLIMDTLGALALSTEPPTDELFQRRPYGRFDSLITRRMWRNILGQSIYQLCFLFSIMYSASSMVRLFDLPPVAQWTPNDKMVYHTIIFNTFVFCQFFNEINCRVLNNELNVFRGIHKSFIFILVVLGCIFVQVILVEFGGEFFGTRHLDAKQWLFCCSIGFGGLIWGFCLRLLPIPNKENVVRQPKQLDLKGLGNINVDIESQPLLGPKSKWRKARNVFQQINVISAFRNQPRLKRTKELFRTKSSDSTPISRINRNYSGSGLQ